MFGPVTAAVDCAQKKAVSVWQLASQPSPGIMPPSSQPSPGSTVMLPQTLATSARSSVYGPCSVTVKPSTTIVIGVPATTSSSSVSTAAGPKARSVQATSEVGSSQSLST